MTSISEMIAQGNGYKIGICEWAFPVRGPYSCKVAKDYGLQGIQLELGDYEIGFPMTNQSIQRAYLDCSAQYDIEFPAIALNSLCKYGMSNNKRSIKGGIVSRTIERGIEVAVQMGIPVVQLPSFDDGYINTESEFENTVSFIQMACDIASISNIMIATENVLSTEENLQLIKDVGRKNLKILFDTQNPYLRKNYNISRMIVDLIPHICMFHLKDGSNSEMSASLLGSGDTSFYDSASTIIRSQFKGWLLLENYYDQSPLADSTDNPYELLEKDIQTVKDTFLK